MATAAMTVRARPWARWPTVAGLGLAALVAADLAGGVALAPVLALSATVYLGAAALGRGSAWWVLLGASAVLTAARATDSGVDPTWLLLAAAVALGLVGLLRGATRPRAGLPVQAAALAGFGAAAGLALAVAPAAGGWLVAAGLVGHAGWDVLHHRADRVVPRSLSEFCLVLDLALAGAIAVVSVS